MNERFTPDATMMMELAQKEAERLNHGCVGTEHILLALAMFAQSRDCEGGRFVLGILSKVGIEPSAIRHKVELFVPAGSETSRGRLPHTPGVQRVIVGAYEEARNLKHNRVAPVHIFLAFMRTEMEYCVAGHVLRSIINTGSTIEKIRQIVRDTLSEPASEAPTQFSAVSATREPEGKTEKNPVVARNGVPVGAEFLHTILLHCIVGAKQVLEASRGHDISEKESANRIALGQAWATLAQATGIAIAAMAVESISVLAAEEAKPR